MNPSSTKNDELERLIQESAKTGIGYIPKNRDPLTSDLSLPQKPINTGANRPNFKGDQEAAAKVGAFIPANTDVNSIHGVLGEGLKAVANVPSSAFNIAKGVVMSPLHIAKNLVDIHDQAKGLSEDAAKTGQTSGHFLAEGFKDTISEFVHKIQGLSPEDIAREIQRTAVNDPLFIPSLLEGGASLFGKTKALDTAVAKVASPVTALAESKVGRAVGTAVKAPFKAAAEASGVASGVGGEAVKVGFKQAYDTALKGDETSAAKHDAFTGQMRGKYGDENILSDAHEALQSVKNDRRVTYQSQLEEVKNAKQSLDITPIQKKLTQLMGDYGVKLDGEGKVIRGAESRSKLAGEEGDIQAIIDRIKSQGSQKGDRTAIGLDNLKQYLGDFYSPSAKSRAFVTDLKNTVKDTIVQSVPEYKKMVGDYEKFSNTIDDITGSLSLGDKANTETGMKKLIGVLKENNEFRRKLVDQLESSGGQNIVNQVAGRQFNTFVPRGLSKYVTPGIGGSLVVGASMKLLPILASASPRILGEFVNALGLSAGQTTKILKIINEAGPKAAIELMNK